MSDNNDNDVMDFTNSTMDSSVVLISEEEASQYGWSTSTVSTASTVSPEKRKRVDHTIDLDSDTNESDTTHSASPSSPSESSKLIAQEKRSRLPATTSTPMKGDENRTDDDMETSWTDIRDRQDLVGSVVMLEDSSIDSNLPETVSLLTTPWGSKVYVVGTAHFSTESQEDVAKVIQAVQPNYIVVELCNSRSQMLTWDEEQILREAKAVNYQMILDVMRTNGVLHGTMYLLLLTMSAHITRELGMAPGGEFRRACKETQKIPNCVIILGDRPIHITLRRALASLSWWQSIKLAFHLLTNREPVKKEDVERCKQSDLLEELIAEMAGEYPELKQVFLNERDLYLAFSLQNAAMMEEGPQGPLPCKVVGVVGIGHVAGIKANWNKLNYRDIPPILMVPPPSRTSRVLRFMVKASLVGVVLYSIHRLTPRSVRPSLPSVSAIPSSLRNMSATLIDYLGIKKTY